MKTLTALVLLGLISLTAAAQSPGTVRLDVQPGSRLWLEGGSNIHDWSCKASTFEAIVDGRPAELSHDSGSVHLEIIQRVTVKVAVRDLKCGNSQMEKDLYAALKADSASGSQIVGIFSASPSAGAQGSIVETDGTIMVAGVEKTVHTQIAVERRSDGRVTARGGVPLLMTDFDVKPPTALRGLVRSHNDVVVRFELILLSPSSK
ncbi:MAG TPA: hypothetical protein VK636_22855 [Gemmatimonadaceae bacterium]|nr:hypothetical protein [Gemmatimonadaceae bacterium]